MSNTVSIARVRAWLLDEIRRAEKCRQMDIAARCYDKARDCDAVILKLDAMVGRAEQELLIPELPGMGEE